MQIDGPVVMDTHGWIWAVEGLADKLGSDALRVIDDAASDRRLFASAISVWELGTLLRKRRIALSVEFERWVAASRQPPGVLIQAVTPEIAMDSAALPAFSEGDPADRLIVSTARSLGAQLMTCDRRLLEYGGTGHLHTYDARP